MISGKMYRFRPHPDIVEPGYLAAFLQSDEAKQAIDRMKTGGSDSGLNLTHERFRQLSVPVAPLPVQRQIVAEIEKQFTQLETGVAALKRVQANLKRYRAAVLKAACEGRLVPTEAELARRKARNRGSIPVGDFDSLSHGSNPSQVSSSDFESGAVLLERILDERRKNWKGRGKYKEPSGPNAANLPALRRGWTWASVEQLGQTTTGFTPPKSDALLFGGNIPFFKPSDLDTGYHVRKFHDSLTEAGAMYGQILPELSILVTCIGATIGKTGLARVRCTTNQQINALTLPNGLISPHFVYWCFQSPFGQRQIIDNASATTLPILNKSRFEALPLPLPPLAEQMSIVTELERRLSIMEKLETAVVANLRRAIRLRQASLQMAFTEKRP
jgi:type I restriction enzyme S subunit